MCFKIISYTDFLDRIKYALSHHKNEKICFIFILNYFENVYVGRCNFSQNAFFSSVRKIFIRSELFKNRSTG